MRNGLKCLGAAVVMWSLCCAAALFAANPGAGDPDNIWRTKKANGDDAPIQVVITQTIPPIVKTGNPEAYYLPINHWLTLTASASDIDSHCKPINKGGDGEWYNYGDNVTSGYTPTDYHILWEVASGDGEFVYDAGPPVVNDKYGWVGTYTAPDYTAGANLRTVTVRAKADDFQRNGDTLGANDAAAQSDDFELKIWQVTVSASQAGTISENNDSLQQPSYGDPQLGWIIPGAPASATGYHGNTELKGAIPAGPGVTAGYTWSNEKIGAVRYKVNGGVWQNLPSQTYPDWTNDFDASYAYTDTDSRHPNGSGADVREIFALDAPGLGLGPNNDAGIGPPSNLTDLHFDMQYRAEVYFNGIRVSNPEHPWTVNFTLDVVNGHWHTVDHSP